MADPTDIPDPQAVAEKLKEMAEAAGMAEEKMQRLMDALASDNASENLRGAKQLIEEMNDLAEARGDIDAEEIERRIKANELHKEYIDSLKEQGKITDDEVDKQKQSIEQKEKALKVMDTTSYELERQARTLVDINTKSFGIGQKWQAYREVILKMKNEDALRTVVNKAADLTAKYFDSIIKATLAFDVTSKQVAKTLSDTKYIGTMASLRDEALAAGSSMEELGATITSLGQNYSNFTRLDAQTTKQLASTGNALQAAGFSAEAFGKSLQVGVKALGMTEKQVDTFNRELVNFGRQAGIPLQKLSSDLAKVAPQLANFGVNGTKVFKQLELQAKNTGIEIDRLLSITEQYTTFEGAANAAGKLNSILGGNFINSLDLMNASLEGGDAAIQLLKDSMDASGKSFDDLPNSMKRVIAEAAGFSDVNEAAAIFNMESADAAEALEAQAAKQEELNKISRSFVDVQQKIQKLLSQMVPIIMPIINVISALTDKLSAWASQNKELISKIGLAVIIFGAAAGALAILAKTIAWLTVITKASFAIFGLFGKGIGMISGLAAKAATALGIKTAATATSGTTAAAATGPMLAFAGAIFMVGAGIGIAAAGLGLFVMSFSKLDPDQMDTTTTALLWFGGAVVALFVGLGILMATGVAEAAIVALLGIGAAAMMIGIGLGASAAGLAFFIYSVGLVADKSELMLKALVLLGAGIFAFGLMLWPVVAPLTAVGAGMAGLGLAFIGAAIGIRIGGEALVKFINDISSIGVGSMLKFALNATILSVALGILAVGLGILGAALIILAPGLLVVSTAALIASIAFVIFAKGVEMLGDNLKTLTASTKGFLSAALELGAGLAILAAPVTLFGIALLSVGTAAIVLGAGILLAAAGFNIFVNSLETGKEHLQGFLESTKGFSSAGGEIALGLGKMALGIGGVGVALAAFLVTGGAGALLLSNLMRDLKDGSAGAATLLSNLEKVAPAAAAYRQIAEAIEKISEALDDLDTDKLDALNKNFSVTVNAVKGIAAANAISPIETRTEKSPEQTTATQAAAPIINLELTVPVKIEGIDGAIARISRDQIKKNADNASSINLVIKG